MQMTLYLILFCFVFLGEWAETMARAEPSEDSFAKKTQSLGEGEQEEEENE